ncbi:MFS transporter [Phycisphaerales bacterium AB-hyl4]|uniref:MFS transporter n=1 Tax=Natronomicrosphaera hydrolytica TaxID=3242702 RepID=A0ABV4U565_9BACT
MKPEVIKSIGWGVLTAGIVAVMCVVGSRRLQNFDAALVGYTFATLFAIFGITYRYAMWLQRPPTALYFKRGWQMFLLPRFLARNLLVWGQRVTSAFALNQFIWRRGKMRWGAHWLIMVGCLMAASITFPLVFGWVHFESPPDQFDYYIAYLFGFPTVTFHVDSLFAKFIFQGLVWAAFLVIAGVMLAFRRRMRDHGAISVQQFGEDILPLILLFAISITGLAIWASYKWMHGYAYEFLAIIHAVTVIFTLLWLPFGKFFHIFQRPAQLGVSFYKDAGERGEQARCARCNEPYASQLHVDDLITVERQLGYRYEMDAESGVDHYQRICPKCRRAMLALAQGRLWQTARSESV